MKNIHKLALYFFVFIILIVIGVALIYGRIHVMTIAHQQLIEEHHELNRMASFMARIDALMAVLVEQPEEGVLTEREMIYFQRLATDLEDIRASSVHSEKFEDLSHSRSESRSFLHIYDEFQDFLQMAGDPSEWEGGRRQLLHRLESMRRAGTDLQGFYISEMGQAAGHAQNIEIQVMHRIVLISIVFLFLLMGAAIWFVYLINKNTLMLIEREKNLTIGLLAQSLSHEIRNPLSIIKSSTSVIRKKLPQDSEEYEITGYLRDEVDRISSLVDQLLQLRATEKPLLVAEDPAQIITQVCRLVAGFSTKAGVDVTFDNAAGSSTVLCDRNQIKQVLINVILNAIEASTDGDVILRTRKAEGRYDILVIDQGQGMDSRTLRGAFAPFFTTKENGSGLGLFVAKNIVEANGGKIYIESSPGKGTTVVIAFKISTENTHG